MTRIVLHIDKLVLRGVACGDANAFSQALQQELQHILSDNGRLQTIIDAGDRSRLVPVHASISANSSFATTDRQIASAIARRLGL